MKVKCLDCNIIFLADTTHHHLDMCPKCGKNGVDYEIYLTRLIGNVKIIKIKGIKMSKEEELCPRCDKVMSHDKDGLYTCNNPICGGRWRIKDYEKALVEESNGL